MRANREVERRILETIEPEALEMGFDIVRVRITGGNRPILQIMAEKKQGGTSVEDCADLSHAISPILDVSDPVSGRYALEVSTPGIDRPLTRPGDFARWTGHLAKIELTHPIDGRKRFTGVLGGEEDGVVKLRLDDNTELEAEVADMSRASLVLTDELIAAARAEGSLPPQPDEDDLGDLEIDEDGDEDDDPDEETQEEDIRP